MTFIVANAGVPFTKDAQVSNVCKASTENINALEKFFGNEDKPAKAKARAGVISDSVKLQYNTAPQ